MVVEGRGPTSGVSYYVSFPDVAAKVNVRRAAAPRPRLPALQVLLVLTLVEIAALRIVCRLIRRRGGLGSHARAFRFPPSNQPNGRSLLRKRVS